MKINKNIKYMTEEKHGEFSALFHNQNMFQVLKQLLFWLLFDKHDDSFWITKTKRK